eukprot:m.176755 g.176755  ORF g.176755 m.176755 type:complete len:772 (-) comp14229_c0_seq1:181-2496(-)
MSAASSPTDLRTRIQAAKQARRKSLEGRLSGSVLSRPNTLSPQSEITSPQPGDSGLASLREVKTTSTRLSAPVSPADGSMAGDTAAGLIELPAALRLLVQDGTLTEEQAMKVARTQIETGDTSQPRRSNLRSSHSTSSRSKIPSPNGTERSSPGVSPTWRDTLHLSDSGGRLRHGKGIPPLERLPRVPPTRKAEAPRIDNKGLDLPMKRRSSRGKSSDFDDRASSTDMPGSQHSHIPGPTGYQRHKSAGSDMSDLIHNDDMAMNRTYDRETEMKVAKALRTSAHSKSTDNMFQTADGTVVTVLPAGDDDGYNDDESDSNEGPLAAAASLSRTHSPMSPSSSGASYQPHRGKKLKKTKKDPMGMGAGNWNFGNDGGEATAPSSSGGGGAAARTGPHDDDFDAKDAENWLEDRTPPGTLKMSPAQRRGLQAGGGGDASNNPNRNSSFGLLEPTARKGSLFEFEQMEAMLQRESDMNRNAEGPGSPPRPASIPDSQLVIKGSSVGGASPTKSGIPTSARSPLRSHPAAAAAAQGGTGSPLRGGARSQPTPTIAVSDSPTHESPRRGLAGNVYPPTTNRGGSASASQSEGVSAPTSTTSETSPNGGAAAVRDGSVDNVGTTASSGDAGGVEGGAGGAVGDDTAQTKDGTDGASTALSGSDTKRKPSVKRSSSKTSKMGRSSTTRRPSKQDLAFISDIVQRQSDSRLNTQRTSEINEQEAPTKKLSKRSQSMPKGLVPPGPKAGKNGDGDDAADSNPDDMSFFEMLKFFRKKSGEQ